MRGGGEGVEIVRMPTASTYTEKSCNTVLADLRGYVGLHDIAPFLMVPRPRQGREQLMIAESLWSSAMFL